MKRPMAVAGGGGTVCICDNVLQVPCASTCVPRGGLLPPGLGPPDALPPTPQEPS